MKDSDTWLGLRRVFGFLRPQWPWMAINLFSVALGAALTVFIAHFMRHTIDMSLSANRDAFLSNVLILLILIALNFPAEYLARYSTGRFTAYGLRDIRWRAGRHIAGISTSYLDSGHSGDIVSRLTNDIGVLQDFLQRDFSQCILQPLLFLGSFTYLVLTNWRLALFSVVTMPLFTFWANMLAGPIAKHTNQFQENLGKLNSLLQDAIGGIQIAKSFNLGDLLIRNYKAANEKTIGEGVNIARAQAKVFSLGIFLSVLPFILCMAYGGYLVIANELTMGSLIAFLNLLNYLVQPLSMMPQLMGSLKGSMAAGLRIFELFEQPMERTDGIPLEPDSTIPPIALRNVSFSYDGKAEVLIDLSFELPAGSTIALVGPSGSGKTTVIKLICGFYEPHRGEILLYGHNLKEWNLQCARSYISLVSQDPYLFPTTIAENIAYGRPGASLEEIIKAAQAANAHEFIVQLPEGYNTMVGERGANLSGGQRQRIAIARAILKDAPILLLDEATSSLDSESERLVQEALKSLMKGKTTLVIAHRLSTIENADIIYVIDEGKVVEQGKHRELLDENGLYKHLYDLQFRDGRDETLPSDECQDGIAGGVLPT